MSEDAIQALRQDVISLRRQTRLLQCGLVVAIVGLLTVALPRTGDVLRARGLVIEDGAGRQRIVLGASGPDDTRETTRSVATLVFKSETGRDRVVIGQEPDPNLGGKVYRRVAPGWGMLVNAADGTERGGFSDLDGRGASISLDRPTGDALGMLVDETSGLSALVLNYDNGGRPGSYPTAFEVGTQGNRAFAEASNRDGTSAGSLLASGVGRVTLSDTSSPGRR